MIPVRPEDWNLLGICWHSKFFVDTCLPFGLRSAPYLFNQLSIAIHWILQHSYGIHHLLHYLDDSFTAGPANSSQCTENLQSMLTLCSNINAPTKSSKVEGPTTSLIFHTCMTYSDLHDCPLQCQYHGVAESTRQTYQSGLKKFESFYSQYAFTPAE